MAAPVVKLIRVGSLSLPVRRYADGRFGFDYTPPGEMRRWVRLRTMADAEQRAREILGAAAGGKVERLAIDESDYADYLRWRAERGSGGLSGAVAESFLAAKQNKGLSVLHTGKLRAHLTHFAKRFPGSLDRVARGEFEAWLNGLGLSARSWNNLRASVVSLYRFARAEGYVGAALCGPERTSKRKALVTVETYTPDELKRLLAVVEDRWLPAVVMQAFCGLRPEEVCPQPFTGKPGLKWGAVLWQKGKIDVPPAVSKTRRRRFAVLTEPAAEFLRPWSSMAADVRIAPSEQFHSQIPRWVKASGVKWRRDGLRHSYASYRLALTQNMPALALEMGNSVAMLQTHYLDLKHEDEAAEWFGIRPDRHKRLVSFAA